MTNIPPECLLVWAGMEENWVVFGQKVGMNNPGRGLLSVAVAVPADGSKPCATSQVVRRFLHIFQSVERDIVMLTRSYLV